MYRNKVGEYWWIILFISICYSFYSYKLIEFNSFMNKEKELYTDISNGKAIESDTYEKKLNWYMVICIDILSKYFEYEDFIKNDNN